MGGQGVTAPVSFLITLRGMKNLCVNLKDPSTSLRMTVFAPDGCVRSGWLCSFRMAVLRVEQEPHPYRRNQLSPVPLILSILQINLHIGALDFLGLEEILLGVLCVIRNNAGWEYGNGLVE